MRVEGKTMFRLRVARGRWFEMLAIGGVVSLIVAVAVGCQILRSGAVGLPDQALAGYAVCVLVASAGVTLLVRRFLEGRRLAFSCVAVMDHIRKRT